MRYNGYCGCLRAACTTGTRDYKVCERHGYYTMDNNQFNQYNNNSGGNGNNNGGSGGNGNGNGRDRIEEGSSIAIPIIMISPNTQKIVLKIKGMICTSYCPLSS